MKSFWKKSLELAESFGRRLAAASLALVGIVTAAGVFAFAQANYSVWNPGTAPLAPAGAGNVKTPVWGPQTCETGKFIVSADTAGQIICAAPSAAPTPTCSPSSVANGTVGSYPGCQISCNSGYTLQGGACVATNTCKIYNYRRSVSICGGAVTYDEYTYNGDTNDMIVRNYIQNLAPTCPTSGIHQYSNKSELAGTTTTQDNCVAPNIVAGCYVDTKANDLFGTGSCANGPTGGLCSPIHSTDTNCTETDVIVFSVGDTRGESSCGNATRFDNMYFTDADYRVEWTGACEAAIACSGNPNSTNRECVSGIGNSRCSIYDPQDTVTRTATAKVYYKNTLLRTFPDIQAQKIEVRSGNDCSVPLD